MINVRGFFRRLFNNKEKVHDIKNQWTAHGLKAQHRARQQKEDSKELLEMLKSSRMYKIAVATGGKNRGLS